MPHHSSTIQRIATPLTMASFAIVGVTGLMLFFHLAEGQIKEAHEWLGLLFVLGAALHVVRHLRPFVGHLKGRTFALIGGVSLIALAAFVVPTLQEEAGGNPIRQTVGLVLNAPLAEVAPLLHNDGAGLVAHLRQAGLKVDSEQVSLEQVAHENQMDPRQILGMILP